MGTDPPQATQMIPGYAQVLLRPANRMGLPSPVHALVVPWLCLITVPLAILAGITTTLAFSVLIFRVFLIYLDILFSLAPSPLRRRHPATPAGTPRVSPPRRQLLYSPPQHRRRRRSSASTSSLGERGLGLIPSVGAERDFEGIGGWRLGGRVEDELWTTVSNPPPERHHYRSPSAGGPTTPGEGGYLMMKGRARSPAESSPVVLYSASPNSSRARTPTGPRVAFKGSGQADGYFALSRNTSPRSARR